MAKLAAIMSITVLPGRRDELRKLWQEHLQARVEQSAAQELYVVVEDADDVDTLHLVMHVVFDGDPQGRRDLLVGTPGRDEFGDLKLPRGQRVEAPFAAWWMNHRYDRLACTAGASTVHRRDAGPAIATSAARGTPQPSWPDSADAASRRTPRSSSDASTILPPSLMATAPPGGVPADE